MSFTIDLIAVDIPKKGAKEWEFIASLREEYYEDKSEAHPKFVKLQGVLTEKYPCLSNYDVDDPGMDESPWADGPMMGNFASRMGMLAVRFSRVEELFPFILEKALELDITVADGQSEKIYRPGVAVN